MIGSGHCTCHLYGLAYCPAHTLEYRQWTGRLTRSEERTDDERTEDYAADVRPRSQERSNDHFPRSPGTHALREDD